MIPSDLELHHKLLRMIALGGSPTSHKGFAISYDPEIPSEFTGAYVPYLPEIKTTWDNESSCNKDELTQVQYFINKLEHLRALNLVKRKKRDNGAYHAYYEITENFEAVYSSLDPEGLQKVKREIRCKNK